MVGKKIIYVCVFVFLGVLIVSSFASASLGSWLKGLFGAEEPDLAPFDVGVQLGNTPPTIVAFIGIFEDCNDGPCNDIDDPAFGTAVGTIQGEAGGSEGDGITSARFKFVVEDPDCEGGSTCTDLPGMAGGPAITYGTNLLVSFTEPANPPAYSNTITAGAGDCVAVSCFGDTQCPDSTASTQQVKYICDMEMNFYDPPSPSGGATAGDRWRVSARIYDSTGANNDLKTTTNFPTVDIIYNVIHGVSTTGTGPGVAPVITWTNLDTNTDDQCADGGGACATAGITATNVGNEAVSSIDLQGEDLVSSIDTDSNILTDEKCTTVGGIVSNCLAVAAFSVGTVVGGTNTGACDVLGTGAEALANPPTIANPPGFSIAYDATATPPTDDLFFCAWDAVVPGGHIIGTSVSSYVANDDAGNQWMGVFT